jgi:hypothetical protein
MKYLPILALAGAPVLGSAALADADATQDVWQRHVAAATAGDLDAVMADFTEESAIITPEGVLSGTAAIRGFFEELLGGLEPGAIESIVSNAEIVHDDVLVANFTIGAAGRTFHDTALIRDDRILVLSTVSYPAE